MSNNQILKNEVVSFFELMNSYLKATQKNQQSMYLLALFEKAMLLYIFSCSASKKRQLGDLATGFLKTHFFESSTEPNKKPLALKDLTLSENQRKFLHELSFSVIITIFPSRRIDDLLSTTDDVCMPNSTADRQRLQAAFSKILDRHYPTRDISAEPAVIGYGCDVYTNGFQPPRGTGQTQGGFDM